MKKIFSIISILVLAVIIASCGKSNDPKTEEDTAITGTIHISVDETLKPVIEEAIKAFHQDYKYANIIATYKPEAEIFHDLLIDSARVIIATRKLTDDEKKSMDQEALTPRYTKIAYDALCVLINQNNKDSTYSPEEIKDILIGKTTKFKSSKQDITLVFDNQNSSIVRACLDLIKPEQLNKKNVFGLKNSQEVLDYVKENKNAMGFLGLNWISEVDSKNNQMFKNYLTVCNIKAPDSLQTEIQTQYYKPHLAYLVQGLYPFRRDIWTVSREARAGLGSGFVAFLAGPKGQSIISRAGLLAAQVQYKIVEIKNREIKIEK